MPATQIPTFPLQQSVRGEAAVCGLYFPLRGQVPNFGALALPCRCFCPLAHESQHRKAGTAAWQELKGEKRGGRENKTSGGLVAMGEGLEGGGKKGGGTQKWGWAAGGREGSKGGGHHNITCAVRIRRLALGSSQSPERW